MEDVVVLKVEGMTCGHCSMTVQKALLGVKGVQEASVDLGTKQAMVKLAEAVPFETMKAAIEEEGYTVVGSEPFHGINLG